MRVGGMEELNFDMMGEVSKESLDVNLGAADKRIPSVNQY